MCTCAGISDARPSQRQRAHRPRTAPPNELRFCVASTTNRTRCSCTSIVFHAIASITPARFARRECKGCLGTFCKGCHGTEQKTQKWGTPCVAGAGEVKGHCHPSATEAKAPAEFQKRYAALEGPLFHVGAHICGYAGEVKATATRLPRGLKPALVPPALRGLKGRSSTVVHTSASTVVHTSASTVVQTFASTRAKIAGVSAGSLPPRFRR